MSGQAPTFVDPTLTPRRAVDLELGALNDLLVMARKNLRETLPRTMARRRAVIDVLAIRESIRTLEATMLALLEEGDTCPEDGCGGRLGYTRERDCSCHISPPCSACVDAPLVCQQCGWKLEE